MTIEKSIFVNCVWLILLSSYHIQMTLKSSTDETATIPPLVVPVLAACFMLEIASSTLFSSTIDITIVLVEYAILIYLP
jgi:hypothetical protein